MGYKLETLNRGTSLDFGFDGSDMFRVRLGDLPAISTPQFCRYSTDSLVNILETSHLQIENIAGMIKETWINFQNTRIRDTSDILKAPRHQRVEVFNASKAKSGDVSSQVNLITLSSIFLREIQGARDNRDEMNLDRLHDELTLAMQTAQGTAPEAYRQNPFFVQDTSVVIGGAYEVDFIEFTDFALYVMEGGHLGWGIQGMPDFAYSCLTQLVESI